MSDSDAPIVGRAGRIEFIPAISFLVDDTYQRGINEQRVMMLVADWDDNAFGNVYASHRKNGDYYLIDGQHRQRAVIAMNRGTALLPTFVVEGLTVEEEADIFWRLNKTRLQPGSADTYKARLASNEPIAIGLRDGAQRHGVEIMMHPAQLAANQLYAIAAAENIYRAGDLDWVFGTIRRGWPEKAGALRQDRLMGMHRFYQVFRHNFDPAKDEMADARYKHLIERMQANPPSEVAERATKFVLTLHSRPATAFARALHETFNAYLKNEQSRVRLPIYPMSGSASYPSLPPIGTRKRD